MKFQSATNKMILSQIIIILIKFTLCPKSNFRGYTIVCFYTSPYFLFYFFNPMAFPPHDLLFFTIFSTLPL